MSGGPAWGWIALWAAVGVAVVALGFAAWQTWRARRTLGAVQDLLDRALAGEVGDGPWDETIPGTLAHRLRRLLGASALARQRAEEERARTFRLIADISHQTKTPLTNVVLYASLLGEQDLPPEARAAADQVAAQAAKLEFLIGALVTTARLEQGLVQVSPAEVTVGDLVAPVVAAYRDQAAARGIALADSTDPAAVVQADAKWTAEALGNLVDNALKYTPAGGHVTVTSRELETFTEIAVTDDGPGIPAEDQTKVFARFWRSPDFAAVEGLGIGLTVARQIAEQQGGYLHVTSAAGQGSAFGLFLPRA